MTELEMIEKMLNMQNALNEDIIASKHLGSIKKDNLFFALFDELGELTHELKHEWCWWKEHQAEVDHDKTLEEYVDVVHFALTYEIDVLKHSRKEKSKDMIIQHIEAAHHFADCKRDLKAIGDSIKEIIKESYWHPAYLLWEVLSLGFILGFSMEDIYNEYVAKNKVNFERLESGH